MRRIASLPRPGALASALGALLLLVAACGDAGSEQRAASNASGGNASGGNGSSAQRARAIIDSARVAAGAAVLDSARVSFDFRGERFRLHRVGARFSYAHLYRDSLGRRVQDVLTGDTLQRRIGGQRVPLPADAYRQAETTVNSVAYFALLPFSLSDPAVEPRHAGTDTVRGTPYHRVAVTFQQEGGGRDWQDRFVYWFDQGDYSMDYLAYAFGLGAGEEYGTRFREAFNVRRPAGVRVADYRNYTARQDSQGAGHSVPPGDLERYGRLLEADSLRLVSTIALDSVRVEPLSE